MSQMYVKYVLGLLITAKFVKIKLIALNVIIIILFRLMENAHFVPILYQNALIVNLQMYVFYVVVDI